jgi:hypothetical protein
VASSSWHTTHKVPRWNQEGALDGTKAPEEYIFIEKKDKLEGSQLRVYCLVRSRSTTSELSQLDPVQGLVRCIFARSLQVHEKESMKVL